MWGYLADENVAHSLVAALVQAGGDVVTVQELGLTGAPDEQVAAIALSNQQIVLTRDVDFLRLCSEAWNRDEVFPPIAYWGQGATRNTESLAAELSILATMPDYAVLCGQIAYL